MKNFKINAFTLAEVLITLGIIGVVAAITIPTIIQNYKNQVVETRLKKVYSIMNQAIILSENDNGNLEDWNFDSEKFLQTYIVPYINSADIKVVGTRSEYNFIYLSDGSLLITKNVKYGANLGANTDYFYYPNAKNFSFNEFGARKYFGSKAFIFNIVYNKSSCNFFKKRGFESYTCGLNDANNPYKSEPYACNKDSSLNFYCTYIIQQNGWKIPKDYPFNVK